tara:strand:+ start:754 stop:1077 length:324 start_codon:yes stop_codon:yes gene_type:complete
MKIYISGPISHDPYHEDSFSKAQEYLSYLGYEVINPVDIPEKDFSGPDRDIKRWEYFMRASIKLLMDCDQIYMLEGWKHSRGAKLEQKIAKELAMPSMYETEDIDRV